MKLIIELDSTDGIGEEYNIGYILKQEIKDELNKYVKREIKDALEGNKSEIRAMIGRVMTSSKSWEHLKTFLEVEAARTSGK